VFRHAHRFPRRIHDPFGNRDLGTTDYLGHVHGKAAARTDADLVPATVHGFATARGGRPPAAEAGWLLHYCHVTFAGFLRRFRHRRAMPARWASGAEVDPVERLWQAIVNDGAFTEAQLEAYFRAQIVPPEPQIAAWRAAAADCVVDSTAVRQAFAALNTRAPAPGDRAGSQ
jgi:hypothetical protein